MTTPSSNNNNIIIGLVGVERSGKDTIADYLVANHNFKKHNMANPIREIAKIMFNWTTDLLTGPAKDIVDPITGIKPRDFFTWFGTDIAQFAIYEQFPALESVLAVVKEKQKAAKLDSANAATPFVACLNTRDGDDQHGRLIPDRDGKYRIEVSTDSQSSGLDSMGFTDRAKNVELLQKHDNNVEWVVNELFA